MAGEAVGMCLLVDSSKPNYRHTGYGHLSPMHGDESMSIHRHAWVLLYCPEAQTAILFLPLIASIYRQSIIGFCEDDDGKPKPTTCNRVGSPLH